MRIYIDGKEYYVNLRTGADHLIGWYREKSQEQAMQTIDVGGGKRIDFTRKSIMRTAMKAAMVPFVIPVIGMMYKLRGLEPPKHEKHEDLIDWMVVKMIEFGGIIEGDVMLHASTTQDQDDIDSSVRVVESISTYGSDIFGRNRRLSEERQQTQIAAQSGVEPETP